MCLPRWVLIPCFAAAAALKHCLLLTTVPRLRLRPTPKNLNRRFWCSLRYTTYDVFFFPRRGPFRGNSVLACAGDTASDTPFSPQNVFTVSPKILLLAQVCVKRELTHSLSSSLLYCDKGQAGLEVSGQYYTSSIHRINRVGHDQVPASVRDGWTPLRRRNLPFCLSPLRCVRHHPVYMCLWITTGSISSDVL